MKSRDSTGRAVTLLNLTILGLGLLAVANGGVVQNAIAAWKDGRAYRELAREVWPEASSVEPYRLRAEHSTDRSPLHVLEFIDYECEFCRANAGTVDGMLERGQLASVTVMQFPITEKHSSAELAAFASVCAGAMNMFRQMHDALLTRVDWLHGEVTISELAGSIGLDRASFDRCLSGTWAQSELKRHQEIAQRLGVQGTPAFASQRGLVQGPMDPQRSSELR